MTMRALNPFTVIEERTGVSRFLSRKQAKQDIFETSNFSTTVKEFTHPLGISHPLTTNVCTSRNAALLHNKTRFFLSTFLT